MLLDSSQEVLELDRKISVLVGGGCGLHKTLDDDYAGSGWLVLLQGRRYHLPKAQYHDTFELFTDAVLVMRDAGLLKEDEDETVG